MATNEKTRKFVEVIHENELLRKENQKLQKKVLKHKLKLHKTKVRYKKILEYIDLANKKLVDLDKDLKSSKISIYSDGGEGFFYLDNNGDLQEIKSDYDCAKFLGNSNLQSLILSILNKIDLAIFIAQKSTKR